ncbi:peptidylprolyl isomerase, partial [Amaricoccus sp. HAR-UPW-R2A-40]
MLNFFRNRKSGFFVWAILILLMVGLTGLGVSTAGNGSGEEVITIGDTAVESDQVARAMKQELDAISNQIGRQLPMSEARQYGIDRMVLTRLASDAALDDEATRRGLSVGDTAVHAMVVATPAFR